MITKICAKANCQFATIEQDISNFFFRKDNQKYCNDCKNCRKIYYQNNKEKMFIYNKRYYQDNKEKFKSCYQNNKEKISKQNKQYRQENKEKIAKFLKQFYQDNKEKIYKQRNEYRRIRWKTDINFKFRQYFSRSINKALKRNNSSKNGLSCSKYLDYSMNDLKVHLESLFESWMTWDNQGNYIIELWDDNDTSTWKWQIDHIIPASDLPYSSMEDENFKKCWTLENLRPYSAKQNLLDGTNRVRHLVKNV